MPSKIADAPITARCHCGRVTFSANKLPATVAFCHCADCKRWTGSPAPAFAAFDQSDLNTSGIWPDPVITNPGVARFNCPECSSPLAAKFDYLADQIYVPLGLIDQADVLPADLHCHSESALTWLNIHDDAPRNTGSARVLLNTKT